MYFCLFFSVSNRFHGLTFSGRRRTTTKPTLTPTGSGVMFQVCNSIDTQSATPKVSALGHLEDLLVVPKEPSEPLRTGNSTSIGTWQVWGAWPELPQCTGFYTWNGIPRIVNRERPLSFNHAGHSCVKCLGGLS